MWTESCAGKLGAEILAACHAVFQSLGSSLACLRERTTELLVGAAFVPCRNSLAPLARVKESSGNLRDTVV